MQFIFMAFLAWCRSHCRALAAVHQPLQLGSLARLTSDVQWLKGQKDLEKTQDYKKTGGGETMC